MTSGVELTTGGARGRARQTGSARDHDRQTDGVRDHARARPQGLGHTPKARGTQTERGANGVAHGITVIGGGFDTTCRVLLLKTVTLLTAVYSNSV